MSKATILEAFGDGQYAVSLEYDTAELDRATNALQDQLATVEADLLTAQVDLIDTKAARQSAANALDAAIDAYRTALQTDPASADSADVIRLTGELAQAAQAVGAQQRRVDLLVTRKLSIARRITFLQNLTSTQQPSGGTVCWCADFVEDASGTVPVAIVPGEQLTAPLVILPREHPDGYGLTYDRGTYGQLVPRMSMTPAAAFYNWAMLPGWQRWMPQFRIGTISFVDTENDTCNLTLESAKSSAGPYPFSSGLNVNLAESTATMLESVPIRYMTCNAAVFEAGDRVLVRFQGVTAGNAGPGNWASPEVIGFVSQPRPCALFSMGFHFLYNDPGGSAPMLGYSVGNDFLTAPAGEWRARQEFIAIPSAFSSSLGESQRYPLYTWYGDAPWKWTGIFGTGSRQYFQDPDMPWPNISRVYTVAGPLFISGLSSPSRISAAWLLTVADTDLLRIVVTRGTEFERVYEIDAAVIGDPRKPQYATRFASIDDFDLVAEIDISRYLEMADTEEVFLQPWSVNRSGTEMMTLRYVDVALDLGLSVSPTQGRFPVAASADITTILSGELANIAPDEFEPTTTESSFTASFAGTLVRDSCVYNETSDEYESILSGSYDVQHTNVLVMLVGVDYSGDERIYYRWKTTSTWDESGAGGNHERFREEGCSLTTGFLSPVESPNDGANDSIERTESVSGHLLIGAESILLYKRDLSHSGSFSGATGYSADRSSAETYTSLLGFDTRYPDVRPYQIVHTIDTSAAVVSSNNAEDPVTETRDYSTRLDVDGATVKQWALETSRTIPASTLYYASIYYNYSNSVSSLFSPAASSGMGYRLKGVVEGDDFTMIPRFSPPAAAGYGPFGLQSWPLIWSSPLMFESPYETMKGHVSVLPTGAYIANMPDIELDYDNGNPFADMIEALTTDGYNNNFWRNHITSQPETLFVSNALTEAQINELAEREEPDRWRVYDIIAPSG